MFLIFSPFRLDLEQERLWKASTEVSLRRKPFAILRFLAENPQRLVSQDELVRKIWGSVVVSESAVRTQLYDLRQALGEGIIETVVGRGYRFLPAVTTSAGPPGEAAGNPLESLDTGVPKAASPPASPPGAGGAAPVGRGSELESLALLQARAAAGERQMVFITGEPGIGKTTLLNAFLLGLPPEGVLVLRGQCVEQSGHGEPYLPLLEGLRCLCESAEGQPVTALLARRAPTWLLQMPGLFPDAELAALQQRTVGANQDRMLRELCEALEHLSVERPVVLALEDLQWSDLSTINLVSMLGSRRSPARVLVIGTARQGDVLQPSHPLNTIYRELLAHGYAQVITPGALSMDQVSEYLRQRFGAHLFPDALATVVQGITGGTPLFLVSVMDDLVKRKVVDVIDGSWSLRGSVDEVATHRPENVRQLIDIQIDRLTPAEQRVLEIGSAIGMEFTAGLVAAAQDESVDAVEEICDGLVRRGHVLRALDARGWPDGTTQSRYAFRHDLYQAVALGRSPSGRRRLWHRRFAERLLAAYPEQTAEVSVELALHFERANDWLKAGEFYAAAGERAGSRCAGLDATVRFKAGLDLVKRAPPSGERDLLELRLLTGIAPRLIEQQLADPAWSEVHARILVLSQSTGRRSPPWPAVFGKWMSSFIVGDLGSAIAGAERLVAVAKERQDSELLAAATSAQGVATFFRGDLVEARVLLEKSGAMYDEILGQVSGGEPKLNHPDSFIGTSRALRASVLWMLGYPDQARSTAELSVEESKRLKLPYPLALSWSETAHLHFWMRDPELVLQATRRASELAIAHAFPVWRTEARVLSAWARVVLTRDAAAFRDLEEGMAERLSLGSRARTFLATVHGEACLALGEVDRGLSSLDQAIAFAEDSAEEVFLSELHRLKGLLLAKAGRAGADAYLKRALDIAQGSSARSFELRAAIGLARLWPASQQHADAVSRLGKTFAWFSEGFSERDLTEARQFLEAAPAQPSGARRRRA